MLLTKPAVLAQRFQRCDLLLPSIKELYSLLNKSVQVPLRLKPDRNGRLYRSVENAAPPKIRVLQQLSSHGGTRRHFLLHSSRLSLLWLGLAGLIGHVHAAQDVVGEEEFAVRRHHHDLQFVGKALGYDFVDQQRILFQDCCFTL